MRKTGIITVLIALLCVLTLCASAGAEKDVASFLNAAEELLFQTDNATVNGQAKLSLDGVWFKTVNATYIQAGFNSYLKMVMTTPLRDGGERDTGYTVINMNGDVIFRNHPIEKFTVLQTGGRPEAGTRVKTEKEEGAADPAEVSPEWQYTVNPPSDTILPDTVAARRVMMTADLAAAALASMPEDRVSVTEKKNGKTLRLALNAEDGNGLINLGLNTLYQYIGDRYFNIGYDTMTSRVETSIDDYGTVKWGLLYAVRDIVLKDADVRMALNADGQPESADGTVTLTLTERSGREQELKIELLGTVSDWGTSSIDSLIPDSALWVEKVETFWPETEQPVTVPISAWDPTTVRVIRWTHEGEAPLTYLLDEGVDVQNLIAAYNGMTYGDPVTVTVADAGDVLTFYMEDGSFTTVRYDNHNLVIGGESFESEDPLEFWTKLELLCHGKRPVEEDTMPMIPYTEDWTLPDMGVTGEKDAVDFAKQVWAMETVKAEYPEDAVWTAENLGGGRWQVLCAWNAEDGEKTLSLTFAGDGAAIETLENGASGFRKARDAEYDIPEDDNSCRYAFNSTLSLFGQRASETLAPGSTDRYREFYWRPQSNFYYGSFNGYLENRDAQFADFYCEKLYGDGETRVRFVIQYLPAVRVVYFSTKVPLEEGGNG